MDFILAHSRYRRHKFAEAIEICDTLLEKNSKDEAAWVLKCQCMIKENYLDELQTEEDGIAEQMMSEEEGNKLAKVGTSFKTGTSSNPIMRPLNSGRVNTGFQRIGTSAASRSGTRSNNMLRTGKIMTRGGVPTTSNGRVLRLSTASLETHGQNFFDSSKVDLRKMAQRKTKARLVFQYLFYVEHNMKKALELAVLATEANNFADPWWKLALGKCYYFLSFYPEAEKQLSSSLKHNNNIESFLYLSRIYEKQDNVEKSLGILRRCMQENPFETKANTWIARLYSQLNDTDRANEEYMRVLSMENCNIEAVASIASNFYYKDQAEISTKLFQRLIELGYDSAEVWNNLALCCLSNNQFELFYSCFQRAITLAKDDEIVSSDIWYNLGYTYSVIGELDLAIEAYKIALSYIPQNVEALNNIGVIESESSLDSAIGWCEKSFKEFDNFEAAYNLSIWYFESNSFEKSHFYNQESLQMYPQHTESLELHSRLLLKLQNL